MARASICPACKKPVAPEQPVYTISEQDHHAECYETWEAERAKSDRDHDRG